MDCVIILPLQPHSNPQTMSQCVVLMTSNRYPGSSFLWLPIGHHCWSRHGHGIGGGQLDRADRHRQFLFSDGHSERVPQHSLQWRLRHSHLHCHRSNRKHGHVHVHSDCHRYVNVKLPKVVSALVRIPSSNS